MMRCASSETSSATAMRMSPSAFTAIGQIAWGLPEIRKLAMPWLSSSAVTTRGFDVGGRGEDDARSGHYSTRTSTQVMSSCCAWAPAKTSTSRSIRSRSSIERQRPVLLDERRQPPIAKPLSRVIGRFGYAVRIQHEQVAGRQGNRDLLQQALERLSIVDLKAQDQPIRRERPDPRRCLRPAQADAAADSGRRARGSASGPRDRSPGTSS